MPNLDMNYVRKQFYGLDSEWINISDPTELVLGSSTSLLVRTLADNFRRIWKPGDEVIVTNCDHEANIGVGYIIIQLRKLIAS